MRQVYIPNINYLRSHTRLVLAIRLVLHQTILAWIYFLFFSCGKNETWNCILNSHFMWAIGTEMHLLKKKWLEFGACLVLVLIWVSENRLDNSFGKMVGECVCVWRLLSSTIQFCFWHQKFEKKISWMNEDTLIYLCVTRVLVLVTNFGQSL